MAHDAPPPPVTVRLLRLPDVCAATGLSKTRLYALQADGLFPGAVRLHGRAVAWRSDDIDAWIAGRPRAGRPTENGNAPAVGAEASEAHG